MANFIEKYKVGISAIFGTLFLISGSWGMILNAFYLTEKKADYTLSAILIALGLIFLWGRLKALANIVQKVVQNKISSNDNK